MERNAFNLEYFKSIRQEINDRIKIHYRVLATKYIATGAVFSFLWTYAENNAEWEAGAFVAASLLSFLFDVLLLENLGWIKRAGAFIKKHVERCPGTVAIHPNKQWIMKWEHYGAQPRGRWTCFSPLGYLFGVWSVGFLLFCGGIATASGSIVNGRRGIVVFTLTLLGYCAISYAYLPRRWIVGFITLVALAVAFGVNALLIKPSATQLMLLAALTVNGVFSGYTLRLVKDRFHTFKLRNALMILLGLKRDGK